MENKLYDKLIEDGYTIERVMWDLYDRIDEVQDQEKLVYEEIGEKVKDKFVFRTIETELLCETNVSNRLC